jgi:hypothetical protein
MEYGFSVELKEGGTFLSEGELSLSKPLAPCRGGLPAVTPLEAEAGLGRGGGVLMAPMAWVGG